MNYVSRLLRYRTEYNEVFIYIPGIRFVIRASLKLTIQISLYTVRYCIGSEFEFMYDTRSYLTR